MRNRNEKDNCGNMAYVVNHYQCGNKHKMKYYNKVQKIVFEGCEW